MGKDISEQNDLTKQMPAKVAKLTQLHEAWLAEMAPPVHGGAKRFDTKSPAAGGRKIKKSGKKKNQAPSP